MLIFFKMLGKNSFDIHNEMMAFIHNEMMAFVVDRKSKRVYVITTL